MALRRASSRLPVALLSDAARGVAPEGVSIMTRQVEWFGLLDFGAGRPGTVGTTYSPARVERVVRAQHKWRFLDATRMQAGLLRDDVREAFEAIWMASEFKAAYDYIDTLTLNLELQGLGWLRVPRQP